MLAIIFTAALFAVSLLVAGTLADSYYRAFTSYGRLSREAAACGDRRDVRVSFGKSYDRRPAASVTAIVSARPVSSSPAGCGEVTLPAAA